MTDECRAAAEELRTAIQQAESEPVRVCVKVQGGEAHCTTGQWMSDEVGYLVVVPKEWQPAHPAPGVPDDVARDAERWHGVVEAVQYIGEHPVWTALCEAATVPVEPTKGAVDAAVDAAMLTAAQAQKGGE